MVPTGYSFNQDGSAVSGSGFVALAATLSTVQTVPVAGMELLLGIERFMSMARATAASLTAVLTGGKLMASSKGR